MQTLIHQPMPRKTWKLREPPRNPTKIRIQPRDFEILYEILRHGFIQVRHVSALLGDSYEAIRKRMRLLFENRYLLKPEALTKEEVFSLGKRGAEELQQNNFTLRIGKLDWVRESQRSYHHIEHALTVTDFLVSVRLACRRTGLKFFWDGQFARWRHRITFENDEGEPKRIDADAFFALEIPGKGRAYHFLESDRHRKKSLNYFQNRYWGYYLFWKSKEARSKRPFRDFRVLTLASQDPGDVKLLRNAAASLPIGNWKKALLFSHLGNFDLTFQHPELVLSSAWKYPDEETPVRLL